MVAYDKGSESYDKLQLLSVIGAPSSA